MLEWYNAKLVGEGDNGMKAVASVIMNRVNVPEYPKVEIYETYYFKKDNLTAQERQLEGVITVKIYITWFQQIYTIILQTGL